MGRSKSSQIEAKFEAYNLMSGTYELGELIAQRLMRSISLILFNKSLREGILRPVGKKRFGGFNNRDT
jgi:hypothetical protein